MIQAIYPIVSLFLPDSFLARSIDDINGTAPLPDAGGGLARRVAAARAKPMKLLHTDELCTLLRQREGGVLALALALTVVGQEALIQADASPGDLFRLTLEYDWADWHAAQRFGIDPWVCLLEAQSGLAGLRASMAALEALCTRLDGAATAQPAAYLAPDPRLVR
ncbi:contact-dependent growth inhibition system immunity protein [Massilia genomosp. 1]|uniref:Uncharacterized protein n=1 Tax=Massilia genomosp. 1 TaxID=2609280 RepID=A0ABX0N0F6_9BURK|nr:contact-dependent growth inhibition system immunity protein [Massilia genomosp. 1]NHZ65823.1 hypothetical protein [Massilia genomosp. 1]